MRTFVSRVGRGTGLGVSALFVVTLAGIVATAEKAFAEFEEFTVNDDILGEEHRQRPRAIALDDGGTFVLWEDNGRGHIDLLGRRFDADFTPVGDPFRINTEEGFFRHSEMEMAPPTDGETVAVWRDERTDPLSIFARRISSADGSPIGGDFAINFEFPGGAARAPRVARSSEGRTLITWIDRVNQRDRVLLQLLDPEGKRVGVNFPVVEDIAPVQGSASVGALADGSWIVVWSERDDSSDWNIFYRFLNADGSYRTDTARANTDLLSKQIQIEPDVMVRAEDILLLWNDRRTGTRDAWGRWIALDGSPPLESDFLLREASDPASDEFPRAVLAEDGSYGIYWFGGLENRQRTMVRFFDADRNPVTPSVPMDDPSAGILFRGGDLIPRSDGTWHFYWGDNRTSTYNNYGRTFDPETLSNGEIETLWTLPVSSTQVYGDMDLFPDGRAVVAWSDMQFGSLVIYARFLDVNGEPVGESFQVSTGPANAAFTTIDAVDPLRNFSPHVAASADGFIITWAINEDGGRLNLLAQFYGADGRPIGGNFRIDEDARSSPQLNPRPVMLPGGGFAIAYQLAISDPGGDIYIRYFDKAGLPEGPRILCIDPGATAADQQLPTIAVSELGDVLVAWIDKRAGGWDVWGQRFHRGGERNGENVAQHGADDPFSDQVSPSVAMLSERAVTVWETRPFTTGILRGRLEILPSARNAQGGVSHFWINLGQKVKGLKSPRVSMAPDGRFVVTWWDNSDGQTQIYAQRFQPDATPIGPAYPIHGSGFEGSRLAVGAAVTSDIIQFTWSDTRAGKGWDIRSRRVDWEFTGAPTPVLLSNWESFSATDGLGLRWQTSSELGFAGFYLHRQIAAENPGHRPGADAIRLENGWVPSNRSGIYEFVDKTAPTGEFLQYFLEAVDRDSRVQFFGPLSTEFIPPALAFSAGPNPFRTSVDFLIPASGPYEVRIHDVTGREVRSLRGTTPDRTASVVWDGRDEVGNRLPTGVYFARLNKRTEALKIIRIE